jgi:hypothetical protein
MKNRELLLAVALLLSLTAGVVQARNQALYLIARQGETEAGAFDIAKITDIRLSGPTTVTIVLGNRDFLLETLGPFTFEERSSGSDTGTESVHASAWKVYYDGQNLHVETGQPAGNVTIYSIFGVVIGRYVNQPVIPLNHLPPGVYVVHDGSHVARFVAGSRNRPQTPAPVAKAAQVQAQYPVAGAATSPAPYYLNIKYGVAGHDLVYAINVNEIKRWNFTSDGGAYFEKIDGNIIVLNGIKSISPDIIPSTPSTSLWDMEKTVKYGGAAYGIISSLTGYNSRVGYISVIHPNGVIIHDVANNRDLKYPLAGIHAKAWSEYADRNRRISVRTDGSAGAEACMSSIRIFSGNPEAIHFIRFSDGLLNSERADRWEFNGHTNIIPSTIIHNADGSITIEATDTDGAGLSHTFTGW